MKITNMKNSNGNDIPSQFIIEGITLNLDGKSRNGNMFKSYNSYIAFKSEGKIYLDRTYWDYSQTTAKYRNKFLNMNVSEIRRGIDEKRIKLVNLNV